MPRIFIFLGIVFSGLLADVACAAAETSPVLVGVLLPLSGSMATYGKAARLSYEMAQGEINAQGGIHGKELRLVFADTRSQTQRGRQLALDFIAQQKIIMMAGGIDPEVSLALAEVAVKHSFPLLLHSSMVDRLTVAASYDPPGKNKEPSDSEGMGFPVFRISPAMGESMVELENFLAQVVKPKSMAVFYENSNFGVSAVTQLTKVATRLGIDHPHAVVFGSDQRSITHAMDLGKDRSYDVVLMVSSSGLAERLVLDSMAMNMNPKIFVGIGRGFNHPRFMENVGKAGHKILTVTMWHPQLPHASDKNYPQAYLEQTNTESQVDGAQAYATTWVIGDVLRRAASFSRGDMLKALRQTDLMTVTGPVKFSDFNDKINQNLGQTCLTQWLDNKQWIIWPQRLANRGYVYPIDWIRERR
ncbi:MAG: Peripla BP 6 protein [Magnetococcales bacterium]|nr:Peripla BP 6 protein [Magnetococcales bacterium]HIJ83566.1 ABC transporter substrate-binding protein [Magnetococcales bacterium]